jgi:hypothetical protein
VTWLWTLLTALLALAALFCIVQSVRCARAQVSSGLRRAVGWLASAVVFFAAAYTVALLTLP